MADRRALATMHAGRPGGRRLPAVAGQRDGRRVRGAALVTRWSNDCRGAAHPGRPGGDRAGRRPPRSRCARSPAFRADAAASPAWMPDGSARALRGRGRRRAVPDLPGRRERPGRFRGSRERAEARSRRTSPPTAHAWSSSATPPRATTSSRCRSTDARLDRGRRRQRRSRRSATRGRRGHLRRAGSQALLSPVARSRRRSGRQPSSPTPTNW